MFVDELKSLIEELHTSGCIGGYTLGSIGQIPDGTYNREDGHNGKINPEREDAYPDTGCGGGCVRSLECPYPVCISDDPGFLARLQRQSRDEKILSLSGEGRDRRYIASEMGIGIRIVDRVLSDYSKNNRQ